MGRRSLSCCLFSCELRFCRQLLLVYAEGMTVAMEYAETHLRELVEILNQGGEVVIEETGGEKFRLVPDHASHTSDTEQSGRVDRVFGRSMTAGAPTGAEWNAMGEEIHGNFDPSDAKLAKYHGDRWQVTQPEGGRPERLATGVTRRRAIGEMLSGLDDTAADFLKSLPANKGHRRLGLQEGRVETPTDEEWRAMDEEIERDLYGNDEKFAI